MEEGFYEESVKMNDKVLAKKKARAHRFRLYTVLCIVIFFVFLFLTLFMPGEWKNYTSKVILMTLFMGILPGIICLVLAVLFHVFRIKMIYEFDYTIVDGNVRISKVFSGIKRRALMKFDCSDIILVGKVDSDDCNRYEKMNDIFFLLATPNIDEDNSNIYFAIINDNGQKTMLYFEPSVNFLTEMRKSAGRNIFEA